MKTISRIICLFFIVSCLALEAATPYTLTIDKSLTLTEENQKILCKALSGQQTIRVTDDLNGWKVIINSNINNQPDPKAIAFIYELLKVHTLNQHLAKACIDYALPIYKAADGIKMGRLALANFYDFDVWSLEQTPTLERFILANKLHNSSLQIRLGRLSTPQIFFKGQWKNWNDLVDSIPMDKASGLLIGYTFTPEGFAKIKTTKTDSKKPNTEENEKKQAEDKRKAEEDSKKPAEAKRKTEPSANNDDSAKKTKSPLEWSTAEILLEDLVSEMWDKPFFQEWAKNKFGNLTKALKPKLIKELFQRLPEKLTLGDFFALQCALLAHPGMTGKQIQAYTRLEDAVIFEILHRIIVPDLEESVPGVKAYVNEKLRYAELYSMTPGISLEQPKVAIETILTELNKAKITGKTITAHLRLMIGSRAITEHLIYIADPLYTLFTSANDIGEDFPNLPALLETSIETLTNRTLLKTGTDLFKLQLSIYTDTYEKNSKACSTKGCSGIKSIDQDNSPSSQPLEQFLDSTQIEVSDKLLLHVLGDFFGSGSKLEGAWSGDMLSFRLSIVRSMIAAKRALLAKAADPRQLNAELATLKHLETLLSDAKTLLAAYRDTFEKFEAAINKRLLTLTPGQSFFLPLGWPGHTVALEVMAQSNSLYRVRLYNTGEAINGYHTFAFIGTQELVLPFIEVFDVTYRKITAKPFLRALQELSLSEGTPKAAEPVDLYETILTQLNGRSSPHLYEKESVIEPQRSGICAYRSISAVLQQHFPDSTSFNHFEFETQLKALGDYFKGNRAHVLNEERSQRLLRKSLESFAAITTRAYKKGWIDSQELQLAHTRANQIAAELLEMEHLTAIRQTLTAPRFTPLANGYVSDSSSLSLNAPIDVSSHKVANSSGPYVELDLSSWKPRASTLLTDLESYQKLFANANEKKQFLNVIDAFNQLALVLPLLDSDVLWKELPPVHVEGIIEALSKLNLDYLRAMLTAVNLDPRRTFQLKSKEYLAQVKLLTFIDKITRQYRSQTGVTLPSLFQPQLEELLNESWSPFQLYDPEWDEQYRIIKNHWDTVDPVEQRSQRPISFFGFEALPAGTVTNKMRSDGQRRIFESDRHENIFRDYYQTWDGGIAWQDVKWAKEWINKPEVRAKIQQQYPDLVGQNESYIAAFALFYHKYIHSSSGKPVLHGDRPNILPRIFYDVRDISWITNFFLSGSLAPSTSFEQFYYRRGISYPGERWVTTIRDVQIFHWNARTTFFDYTNEDNPEEPKIQPFKDKTQYSPISIALSYHLERAQDAFPDASIENIYTNREKLDTVGPASGSIPHRQRIEPNAVILKDPKKDLNVDLGLQATRELLLLSSIKELQVLQAIAYFHQRSHYLKEPAYQMLFKQLVFEPGLLFAELSKDPQCAARLLDQLAAFCQEQFQFYRDLGDINTAAYFLEMNRLFNDYVTHNLKILPTGYNSPFLDMKQELRNLLTLPHLSEELKSLIYRDLARCYVNASSFTADTAAEMLTGVIYHKLYIPKAHSWQVEAEIELRDLLRTHRAELKRILDSTEGSKVLNKVYATLRPNQPLPNWQLPSRWTSSTFPIIVGEGSPWIHINAVEGIFEAGDLGFLPEEITNHSSFREVFGDNQRMLASKSPGDIYHFFHGANGVYFAFLEPSSGKMILQQQREDNLYRLIERESLLKQLKSHALILGHLHWYAAGPTPHVLVMPVGSSQPRYRIDLTGYGEMKDIHLLTAKGQPSGLVLYHPQKEDPNFSTLSRFEDPAYTLIWVDKAGGKPRTIELPRFDLNFQVEERGGRLTFVAPALGHYALAPVQQLPQLGDVSHYLILQKQRNRLDTRQLILFPFQSLQELEQGSLITQTIPNRELPEQWIKKHQYFVYHVNPNNGQLIPSSESGRLYLALVYLWKHQYNSANALLRSYGSQLNHFSADELTILQWIVALGKNNKDGDPRAQALRLQAHFLLLRHMRDFGADALTLENPISTYRSYLDNADYLDDRWLLPEEEALIIENLLTQPLWEDQVAKGRIVNRLNSLQPLRIDDKAVALKKEGKTEPIQQNVPSLYTPGFTELNYYRIQTRWLVQHYQHSKAPSQTNPLKLLRGSLWHQFIDLYKLVKGELSSTAQKALLSSLTGITYSSALSHTELQNELGLILRIIQGHSSSDGSEKDEVALAKHLEAVLYFPSQFPSSAELEKNLQASLSTSPEAAEKATEWLTRYYCDPINQAQQDVIKKIRPTVTTNTNESNKPTSTAIELANDPYKRDMGPAQATLQLQVCLFLEGKLLKDPIVLELDNYLVKKTATAQQLSQLTKTALALDKALDVPSLRGSTQVAFDQLRNRITAYATATEALTDHYTLTHPDELARLRQELIESLGHGKRTLAYRKKQILQAANQPPIDKTKDAFQGLNFLGDTNQAITLDELIIWFLHRDAEQLYKRNASLTLDQISNISQNLLQYLIEATYLQQVERIITQLYLLEKQLTENKNDKEINALIQEFATQAQAQRQYEVDAHPEYLVFEYYMGILLRPAQLDGLDNLKNSQWNSQGRYLGALLEMIMGSGKTAVLLPLISKALTDQDNLALVVMPEPLLASKAEELQKHLGSSFHQAVEVITLNRQRRLKTDDLSNLHKRLLFARDAHRVVMMTNSTIQSIFLNFLVWLDAYGKSMDKVELDSGVTLFRQILSLLKTSSSVTVDEVDFVFDVLKSHHFAMGESQTLQTELIRVVCDLYEEMTTHAYILKQITFSFVKHSGAPAFTDLQYGDRIKTTLIRKALDGSIGKQEKGWLRFLAALQPAEHQELTNYLLGKNRDFDIGKLPNDRIRNIVTVLYEELNRLIPLTAKRYLNMHYGPSHPKYRNPKTKYLAIPYHLGSPSIGSQFGNELEILNYTIQMYLEQGLPEEVVQLEITRLQGIISGNKKSKKVSNRSHSIAALELFKEMRGPNESIGLFTLTPEELKIVTAHVNATPKLLMRLLRYHVLPQIRIYDTQLSTNAQIYKALFDDIRGFSGTLWNAQTYPPTFSDAQLSNTAEKTLFTLWSESPHQVDIISATSRSDNAIQKNLEIIYQKREIPPGSLIDTAGLFRGLSNEAVAREILNQSCWGNTSITGVVYYGEDDKHWVVERNHAPQRLTDSYPKEHLIAYWDQKHTTGSDLKLSQTMTAVVTVSRHTSLRDLLQAVWRLRQLGQGQVVSFAVSQEDYDSIKETLGAIGSRPKGNMLTLKDVLLYVQYYEATRQGDHNQRSLSQKLHALPIGHVVKALLDLNIPNSQVAVIYMDVKDLFEKKMPEMPFQRMGKLDMEIAARDFVESEIQHILDSKAVKAFKKHTPLATYANTKSIATALHELAERELPYLPDTVKHISGYEHEVSVETQQEQETEINVEAETETDRSYQFDKWDTALPVLTWPRPKLFQRDYFDPNSAKDIHSYGYKPFKGNSNGPLIRLAEGLEAKGMKPELAQAFKHHLFVSLNQMPIHQHVETYKLPFAPFGLSQKENQWALVIQDKASNALDLLLLDHNDAKWFDAMLTQDGKTSMQEKREVRLGLYNLSTGLVRTGRERIQEDELEANPEFMKLKIQAKFLGGRSDYSKSEIPLLTQWLKTHDAAKMRDLFLNQILRWKDANKNDFPGSALEKVFQELCP